MKNAKKTWTPEDEEFLLESYGSTSMKYMMGILKTSEESIKQKYKSLTGFVDVNIAGGLLSPRQIAPSLGVDHRTIIEWIHHHGLKAVQLHRTIGANKKKRYRYFIDAQNLWKWVRLNKERINFSQVKRGEILPEPDWLEEEIKQSSYRKRSINWSTEEDESAFFLWQSGVNYREIATRLGRPPKGVQRRLTAIRKRKGVTHEKTN